MKKASLFFFTIIISISSFSQQSNTSRSVSRNLSKDLPFKFNEIKVNLLTSIVGLHPEVSYERLLAEDFTVGGSVGINLGNEDYYQSKFDITPYARWFFSGNSTTPQKFASGFFIELNSSVSFQEYYKYDYYEDDFTVSTRYRAGAGLGLAIGWKYISNNNWVGEVYTGGGRNFVNHSGYIRFGLSIGRRF